MKVALAQINPCIGDFAKNCEKIKSFAYKAAESGCGLVVFPELAVSGYPPGDLLERADFIEASQAAMNTLIQEIFGIAVICGNITKSHLSYGNPLHNSAILFEDGKIVAEVHKRLLPSYDVFDETRYFEPGRDFSTVKFHGLKLGIAVCEDIWNDEDFAGEVRYKIDPLKEIVGKGCDLLTVISASPYSAGRITYRINVLKKIAVKYNLPIVYNNTTGGQDSLVFDGGSFALGADGSVITLAKDFEEDMVFFDLDSHHGQIHKVSTSPEEEIVKALGLALTDYTARCGVSRVVIGLSGGIDSAVTAAIAARALGAENVLGVLMPSEFTSCESVEDAELLSKNLGIRTETVAINEILNSYNSALAPVFAHMERDITEENLQARIRGCILMAISNKFGHLVLSTGNKSESAVGYCTLYGDMCGGYALISDVPKTMVYRIGEYLNLEIPLIPRRIFEKPPTAELRPEQTDQDDLPPYDIIDDVVEMYVEKRRTLDEIEKAGIDRQTAAWIIGRITWSEYKRKQAAIGPRVTSKAFVNGWRYPVAHCFYPL